LVLSILNRAHVVGVFIVFCSSKLWSRPHHLNQSWESIRLFNDSVSLAGQQHRMQCEDNY